MAREDVTMGLRKVRRKVQSVMPTYWRVMRVSQEAEFIWQLKAQNGRQVIIWGTKE